MNIKQKSGHGRPLIFICYSSSKELETGRSLRLTDWALEPSCWGPGQEETLSQKQWGTLSQEKGDWYLRSELKLSSGLDICSSPPPTTSLNRFLFTTFLASMITQKTWHASDCTVGVDEGSSVQVCTQIDLIINCEINSSFYLMIRYWNMKSGLLLYSHSVYSGSW